MLTVIEFTTVRGFQFPTPIEFQPCENCLEVKSKLGRCSIYKWNDVIVPVIILHC